MADTNKEGQTGNLWTFLFFLVLGAIYIIVTKSNENFQENYLVLIVGPLVCLAGYALLSGFFTKNLSHEQKGDNCYYLGFLYTLLSLSMSLIEVSASADLESNQGLEKLLYGFGLAVISTIGGIVLRVIFHQISFSPKKVSQVETESVSTDSINSELINALELISDKFAESAEVNKALTDNSIRIVASLNDINEKLTEIAKSNSEDGKDLKPIVSELVEVTKNVSNQNAQLLEINRRQENLLEGAQGSLNKQTETLNSFVSENEVKPLMTELVSVVKSNSDQNSELVKVTKDQGNQLSSMSESLKKQSETEVKIMNENRILLTRIEDKLDSLKVNFIIFTLSRFKRILRIFRRR